MTPEMPSESQNQNQPRGEPEEGGDGEERGSRRLPPSMLLRTTYAAGVAVLQSANAFEAWQKGWQDYFNPPKMRPDIVKTYECRPALPVRIFFPSSYDQTSPQTLPVLMTIHGGGWCMGSPPDDDEWNRTFADQNSALVVSLNYSKAPQRPFPAALHDVEALFHAVVADASLPIDKARIAVGGFSAGGNLSLALCQLPSIKENAPTAVVAIYPACDFTVAPHEKAASRPYKPALGGKRGGADYLLPMAPAMEWAYVPYFHDLRDPLLSPMFAPRDKLPPYVCVVAAELDVLAHEDWRFACSLAGKKGTLRNRVGRAEPATEKGALELEDERFAWEDEASGVKWLLVPDVIHGFDLHPPLRAHLDEETAKDGDVKAVKYIQEVGGWLLRTAWK